MEKPYGKNNNHLWLYTQIEMYKYGKENKNKFKRLAINNISYTKVLTRGDSTQLKATQVISMTS